MSEWGEYSLEKTFSGDEYYFMPRYSRHNSTANGNNGVGQLTSESFTGSGNLSGSYAYTYDVRGQQTQNVETVNGTSYSTQGTYNDAGQLLTQTYPTGETVTPGYSSTGWLTGLATSAGGTTTLASNLTYSGLSGAAGKISSMSLGNGTYSYAASYDTGLRLTSAGLTNSSSGTQLYQTQPTYDAVNNVVGVQTSVGGQTDTQQFCYDDLNRLTWSGTNGTPPCSGASITAGTLTGAQYQQSDSYNVDGGLVSGPAGSYVYGDSNHPHAVNSTSNGYGATYDAAGNLICRATSNSTSCSGSSPTGQQLSYDAQGRLSIWQNHPTSPTATVNYLYDGSGTRVATQSTVNGTTTLTSYIGSIEEVQSSGSSTQTTTYYAVGGKRVAADVNGTFYYFGYDALGSQVAVLNATGSLVGAQLYGPYGASRYNTGTLPTSIGFTGQRPTPQTALILEDAAVLYPQSYFAYLCRGVALWLHSQIAQALTELKEAQHMRPDMWDAPFWQAIIYGSQGQTEAIRSLEQALQLAIPSVLLAPLHWLEQDQPIFYEQHIALLLASYNASA